MSRRSHTTLILAAIVVIFVVGGMSIGTNILSPGNKSSSSQRSVMTLEKSRQQEGGTVTHIEAARTYRRARTGALLKELVNTLISISGLRKETTVDYPLHGDVVNFIIMFSGYFKEQKFAFLYRELYNRRHSGCGSSWDLGIESSVKLDGLGGEFVGVGNEGYFIEPIDYSRFYRDFHRRIVLRNGCLGFKNLRDNILGGVSALSTHALEIRDSALWNTVNNFGVEAANNLKMLGEYSSFSNNVRELWYVAMGNPDPRNEYWEMCTGLRNVNKWIVEHEKLGDKIRLTGIPNFHNTCFANAIFQLLYNIDILRESILNLNSTVIVIPNEKGETGKIDLDAIELVNGIKEVMYWMSRESGSITIDLVRRILSSKLIGYEIGTQQDAEEFLNKVVSALTRITDVKAEFIKTVKDIVLIEREKIFVSEENTWKENVSCNTIVLPVYGVKSISEAFTRYIIEERESLAGAILSLPDVLQIKIDVASHEYDGAAWKSTILAKDLVIETNLSLKNCVLNPREDISYDYVLRGVVIRLTGGGNINSGHWYTAILSEDGKKYQIFNDEHICEERNVADGKILDMHGKEVTDPLPVILIYERR